MAAVVTHARYALDAVKLAAARLSPGANRTMFVEVRGDWPRNKEILQSIEKAATAALDLFGTQALVALSTIELSVIHEDLLSMRS